MAARRTKEVAIPTPADDLAILVWSKLAEAEHDGLSIWEMERELPELTKHQIRRGLSHISHVLQLTREQPMVIVRIRGRGHVYRLPEHCPDYRVFALKRLQELTTRVHTELTRAMAAVLCWPDDMGVYVPKMFQRMVEDIEDLMLNLAEDDPTPEPQPKPLERVVG